jgi:autonomous glycyl radical cofactor GrcA
MSELYKHWMYNIKTREAKLFNSVDDYNEDEWVDTPALCDAEEPEVTVEVTEEQEVAKTPQKRRSKNTPNERLLNMIEIAKIENAN